MKISVVVCTSGREFLGRCIESLEDQTFSDYEVIIVHNDDLSTEHNFRSLAVEEDNLSIMRNKGMQKSEGDVIAFIDDDAVARENWLENIMESYEQEGTDCVGGKIVPDFETQVPDDLKRVDRHILYGMLGLTFAEYEESTRIKSPLLWGCNISFRKQVLEEIGPFPKELGRKEGKLLSDEERYLQIKAMDNGYGIVFNPDAVVKHRIYEEQLNEQYFLKRSVWQGISEVKRLEIEDQLKGFKEFGEGIDALSGTKLLDKVFKFWSTGDIKERIDLGREIGRLIELRRCVKLNPQNQ